jgi:hypothetical protein
MKRKRIRIRRTMRPRGGGAGRKRRKGRWRTGMRRQGRQERSSMPARNKFSKVSALVHLL